MASLGVLRPRYGARVPHARPRRPVVPGALPPRLAGNVAETYTPRIMAACPTRRPSVGTAGPPLARGPRTRAEPVCEGAALRRARVAFASVDGRWEGARRGAAVRLIDASASTVGDLAGVVVASLRVRARVSRVVGWQGRSRRTAPTP